VGGTVLIAGGGAIGSACAYFLASCPGFAGEILVIEPDPTYREAASSRSASSIRQQFSTPLNIDISRFGMEFLREAGQRLDEPALNLGLVESSYLYLATSHGRAALGERAAVQRGRAVAVREWERAGLAARYPWLYCDDLAAGCDTEHGEGWFDGHALLAALRRAGERRGARYLRDRVIRFERSSSGRITHAFLEQRGRIECAYAVNAAGTRSRELAASVGIELPVVARKRNVFVFTCPVAIPRCPLVIDPSGLWFRPEGNRFLCGPPQDPDPDVSPADFEAELAAFETRAWPLLAHRVPAFEAIRMTSAWAGHYDYNTFDQNAFIGPAPGIDNLLLASGFSGHGIQQSPAIGRGLAEQICYSEYRTLDLAPLSYARYLAGAPLRELNVI
jgi:FAD-dependent oxidoreductase domain-containing protein 1